MKRHSSLAVIFGVFVLILIWAANGKAQADGPSDSLSIGDRAPDFTLPCANRDSISGEGCTLSSFLGEKLTILAFYPADWSGGCTKEVCALRDNFSALSALNAQVIAVSGDYVYAHHQWAKELGLPFLLLSDHSHTVASRYMSYNASTGFNKRTVFVIDARGIIQYIDLEYRVRDDASFIKLRDALQTIH